MPDEPECPFGPAIPDMEACDWSCPPCEIQCEEPKLPNLDTCSCECPPPGEPECVEQRYDEETCSWVGECLTCEDIELEPGCYPGNIDNVAQFKSYFEIDPDFCITRLKHIGSKPKSCIPSPIRAQWVVVKGGPQFRLYQNVGVGDQLCTYCPTAGLSETECAKPDISHISFFGCCR